MQSKTNGWYVEKTEYSHIFKKKEDALKEEVSKDLYILIRYHNTDKYGVNAERHIKIDEPDRTYVSGDVIAIDSKSNSSGMEPAIVVRYETLTGSPIDVLNRKILGYWRDPEIADTTEYIKEKQKQISEEVEKANNEITVKELTAKVANMDEAIKSLTRENIGLKIRIQQLEHVVADQVIEIQSLRGKE